MLKLSSLGTLKNRLPRLPKIAGLDAVESLPRKLPNELKVEEVPFEQKYAPYRPFGSSWEVFTWIYLHGKDPFWQTQVQFGRAQSRGSTRVDFLHPVRRIALYLDGSYWHIGTREAKDTFIRAQVQSRGYRVVVWLVTSSNALELNLPTWYHKMMYQGSNFESA